MLSSFLAGLVSGETAIAVRRAKAAAIAYALAGLLALCGIGFLIGALYIWASRRYGPIETASGFGVGFIVLAIVVLLIHRLASGTQAKRAAERRKSDIAAIGIATAIAALPTLMRRGGGLALIAAPVLAVAAYTIFRENARPRPRDGGPADPLA